MDSKQNDQFRLKISLPLRTVGCSTLQSRNVQRYRNLKKALPLLVTELADFWYTYALRTLEALKKLPPERRFVVKLKDFDRSIAQMAAFSFYPTAGLAGMLGVLLGVLIPGLLLTPLFFYLKSKAKAQFFLKAFVARAGVCAFWVGLIPYKKPLYTDVETVEDPSQWPRFGLFRKRRIGLLKADVDRRVTNLAIVIADLPL